MDYEFLDDFFLATATEATELEVRTAHKYKNYFFSDEQIDEEDYDSQEMYDSHPLKLMIKHQQTELLSHPLCRALVRHKWTQFGQIVFYFNLLFYCVFVGVISQFMVSNIRPHDPLQLASEAELQDNNPKYEVSVMSYFETSTNIVQCDSGEDAEERQLQLLCVHRLQLCPGQSTSQEGKMADNCGSCHHHRQRLQAPH